MKVNKFNIILIFIIILAVGLAFRSMAQEEAGGFEENIVSMEKKLGKAQRKYAANRGISVQCGVIEAQARLKAIKKELSDNPDEKSAMSMLKACSLMVETATLELKIEQQKIKLKAILNKIIGISDSINAIHETLNRIERSKTTKLKEQLDAEKENAAKLRSEAQRRFNALQSELISVKKDARGTIISMSDILFAVDKASLTSDLKTNLAKIAGILTVFKGSKIIVEGHTDNQGSAEYNLKLSQKRAKNVMNFLIKQGVDPKRLTAVGYGLTRPVADNSTREGRQKNRRVDLIIKDTAHQKQE